MTKALDKIQNGAIIGLEIAPRSIRRKASGGVIFLVPTMTVEPLIKRTISFIDGQNLYHSVRESFGYSYPNTDVVALSKVLCQQQNWHLIQVRFYTGVPDPSDDLFWNNFWNHKLAMLGRQKVFIYSRPLRYRHRLVKPPNGTEQTVLAGEEKGIDKTDWIQIDQATYDRCIDPRDYRLKESRRQK